MPSLKDLRVRTKSVQSTKKITSAMKMIAAAKLRKAQDRVQDSRPYANLMGMMMQRLIEQNENFETPPPLLVGPGKEDVHLIVLLTSDRGLCGGFNTVITKAAATIAQQIEESGTKPLFYCIGKRGRSALRALGYGKQIIDRVNALDKPSFLQARRIAAGLLELFEERRFDHCTMVFNKFLSPIQQVPRAHRLIPFTPLEVIEEGYEPIAQSEEEYTFTTREKPPFTEEPPKEVFLSATYTYEPSEPEILKELLPKNLAVQLYRAILENCASEHGARMTAMDGATRNADDMIKRLRLKYNQTRQAYITKELIEIITGAEAL